MAVVNPARLELPHVSDPKHATTVNLDWYIISESFLSRFGYSTRCPYRKLDDGGILEDF